MARQDRGAHAGRVGKQKASWAPVSPRRRIVSFLVAKTLPSTPPPRDQPIATGFGRTKSVSFPCRGPRKVRLPPRDKERVVWGERVLVWMDDEVSQQTIDSAVCLPLPIHHLPTPVPSSAHAPLEPVSAGFANPPGMGRLGQSSVPRRTPGARQRGRADVVFGGAGRRES